MALAASDFSLVKRRPVSAGTWLITGKYTGPASYASGGEALTNAILKAALGINKIDHIAFTHLVDTSGNTGAMVSFDYVSTGSTQGKIRVFNTGQTAHLHSFLVKGSQAAAGTDAVSSKGSSPNVIGKESATDLTSLGGATNGGVQNSTATAAASEVGGTTALNTFSCRFTVYGC